MLTTITCTKRRITTNLESLMSDWQSTIQVKAVIFSFQSGNSRELVRHFWQDKGNFQEGFPRGLRLSGGLLCIRGWSWIWRRFLGFLNPVVEFPGMGSWHFLGHQQHSTMDSCKWKEHVVSADLALHWRNFGSTNSTIPGVHSQTLSNSIFFPHDDILYIKYFLGNNFY